eukprot:9116205-Pyramimonas_sp.AAC.1
MVLDTAGAGAHKLVEVSTFRPTAPSKQRYQVRRPVGSAILAWQEARRREYGDVRPHRLQVGSRRLRHDVARCAHALAGVCRCAGGPP